ncbi:glycoside hydrolase family 65 protein [Planosporangium flavigriseum]|uniref:Glycosyl hydrolase n=1 Tax=Planosporangium flavigriseum TaxID=373681 RepID=A0A8J3PN82_9ACTN|nr:glycoside hydrolase family 65 protein [Planosporangium flavigriseum]NJC63825.1 glycoside hydrolase family 65 protein [Planosporangium flavigriseum]GIG73676.1 glycosyl hydrolase [Planosporangium flavigriseum]
MITHPAYPSEPWTVGEKGLDLNVLAQSESVFALSNGHIGLRGNLDEGEPHGLPGTYLNSVFEFRPLPYAEAGYGYPPSGQTVINVTNGKLIRLLVEDEPFDVRYGELRSHNRVLSLRDGVLRRTAEWTSPSGHSVHISSTRLVSFTQRATAAIAYEVRPVDGPLHIVLQSELVTNEQLPPTTDDPRATAALTAPLQPEQHSAHDARAHLVHTTRLSGRRIGAAMDHTVHCPADVQTSIECSEDTARLTLTTQLAAGQPLRVVKFLSYGWSSQRSIPAISAQVEAALALACATGWEGLLADQRRYLDDYWAGADVDLEGDAEVQQAVRFALFQVLQASARAERRPIPAKGLTGPGYDGHAFWDTESYVLPALTYTAPHAAADALRWRHLTIPAARKRARELTLDGAAFPWRTITGEERSGYWPAGTAAFHINADIADAAIRLVQATGDEEFDREVGLELLVETARLWSSLGFHRRDGQFRIDGVTGPDEYTALCDNNVYTNLMAQRNLRGAVEAAKRHPDQAAELGVDDDEIAAWERAADEMLVPYDVGRGVHPQAERFTDYECWDFEHTRRDQYPLLLHFPYFDLYRKQVVKQADLVLALYKRGDAFTAEEKARDFAYYEPLTVRDSSLSACIQSVMAAEVGHLDLAYAYLGEAARMDLDDLAHNTGDGLHIASLAGAWIALVAGFGGMRDSGGSVAFAPRLPGPLTRLTFSVLWQGQRLCVVVTPAQATYSLGGGDPVELAHHGRLFTLRPDRPVTYPIPPIEPGPRPSQPPGREPGRLRPRRA